MGMAATAFNIVTVFVQAIQDDVSHHASDNVTNLEISTNQSLPCWVRENRFCYPVTWPVSAAPGKSSFVLSSTTTQS